MKRRWPAITGAILLALSCSITAFSQSRLSPATYLSHFQPNPGAAPESGSRDGWESFPIAQEAGYDPTINPETSAGTSALVRESAPSQDGPFQLGFIRRVHMATGRGSSLRVRVKFPYVAGRATVRVSFWRGQSNEDHSFTISGRSWQEIVCPLSVNSTPLSAIAIAADFPNAVRGRPERFLIADVRIRALATRRIDIVSPHALWDPTRELYYLQQAYQIGDQLAVAQHASDAHWALTDPDGAVAGQGSGGTVQHLFAAADKPGVWTLAISDNNGSSTALLLLKPTFSRGLFFDQPPSISPGLLLSIRDRRTILEKTAQPETGANIAAMDARWLLPGLPSYFSILLQSPELAMLDAMEYSSTHDPTALARSLALLRTIATWPEWVHPWFPAHGYHSYYPVGIMTKYVVLAEQFLGTDLPADDRSRLDARLMELSIKPIYEEYVHEDRLQFNTSNWIGNTAGGALLAALASSDSDAAGYALGLYVKERDHVRSAYTADGSYGEGISYHRFDLEMTSLAAAASKRLLGQSLDNSLAGGERYLQYAAFSPEGVLDFGDSHVDLRSSNVFAYQASLNTSPSLIDFYFKYRDTGTAQIISRVLFEASIEEPLTAPASPPPSHLFEHRGITVLRDSWAPASSVVAMRAGPNFNHNHADEGSLFFAHAGKIWLGEAGYADYYKDPSYLTFNIQASGHNTLLVDGNAESQVIPGNNVFGTYPHFSHSLIGESVSLVQADLTSAYEAKLQRYTRTLFFQADGPLVVIDEIEAPAPHTFTLLWHPKQDISDFSSEDHSFRLSSGDTSLALQAFSSSPLSASKAPSPLPLADYERSEHEIVLAPVHFEISTQSPSRTATIVTFIQPEKANQPQPNLKWVTTFGSALLHLSRDSGIEIDDQPVAGAEHHASSIFAWWKHGALLIHGTLYSNPDLNESIAASHPVDMRITQGEGALIRVEIDAAAPTDLQFQGLQALHPEACPPGTVCTSSAPVVVHIPAGHASLVLHETAIHNQP